MTEEEYLTERLQDQLDWYDKKSSSNQKMYKWLRILEIGCASIIPLLSGFIDKSSLIPWVIGFLGITVAVIAGLLNINKYQENWVQYRTTAETLKHQKFLYLTSASPYHKADRFKVLVETVERIISTENSIWVQEIKKDKPEE